LTAWTKPANLANQPAVTQETAVPNTMTDHILNTYSDAFCGFFAPQTGVAALRDLVTDECGVFGQDIQRC
jgi:hypothetical protein